MQRFFKVFRSMILLVLIGILYTQATGKMKGLVSASAYSAVNSAPSGKKVIITDQALNRIIIADIDTKEMVWEWKPIACGVRSKEEAWFGAPSEVKAVLGGKYILMTASKGGIALIRISDKKTVFYAYAGGNTHSAALLPDGNIVSASSTDNYLMVFRTDTLHFPDAVYSKKIMLPFAHNVVWDKKRAVLWSAGKN